MKKLCILVGATILGSIGWWIGNRLGFMAGFVASVIGSAAGVYVGWRVYRDYLG